MFAHVSGAVSRCRLELDRPLVASDALQLTVSGTVPDADTVPVLLSDTPVRATIGAVASTTRVAPE